MNTLKIDIAGENAVIIYFSDKPSSEIAGKLLVAQHTIREHCQAMIIDLVPSYTSILVIFDLFYCDHFQLISRLRQCLAHIPNSEKTRSKVIKLPVYYGIDGAPDLIALSRRAQLSVEEVVNIHQNQEYRVYAIGFAPGFAYLGDVDERISTPRLNTPRLKVPRGSVAIADRQTAVYPNVSPGGWHLIGLCPTKMFDLNTEPNMPVNVGDRVKFYAVNKKEFMVLGGSV